MRSFQSKCGHARPSGNCRGRSFPTLQVLTVPLSILWLVAASLLSHPSSLCVFTSSPCCAGLCPHFPFSERCHHFGLGSRLMLTLSRVQLFVTPWTVAHQASLSMGFSRQEYWSGLPFPSPGDLPNQRIKPTSPASPILAGRSLPLATWSRLVIPFIVMTSAKTLSPNRFTL